MLGAHGDLSGESLVRFTLFSVARSLRKEEELREFYSLPGERRQNKSDPYPKCREELRPRTRDSETAALPQMYTGENGHPLL